MAWRSSGTNNDEMVDNLKRFGVITVDAVESGFRNVDRKYFVPKIFEDIAHTDQPLKEGNIHISAPHIYGSALEALELVPNSSLSFLNVGSGTGYVSAIVADILGSGSLNYGVEIHKDAVDHSKASIEKWTNATGKLAKDLPQIEILHGNGLHISSTSGESIVGFDRIYIGAAVGGSDLPSLTKLLRPGGILVGPVNDELVKVIRIGSSDSKKGVDRMDTTEEYTSDDFAQQVLSSVRFSPLLLTPKVDVIIPSRIWQPDMHKFYPDSFRKACKEIMLCSHSDFVQPLPPVPEKKNCTNLAAMLPQVIWMEILSYTSRSWFEPTVPDTEILRKRLTEERANVRRANKAKHEAEAKLLVAQRERDVYRLLARRWQTRVQALAEQMRQNASGGTLLASGTGEADTDNIEDGRLMLALNGHEQAAIFGLGSMLRQTHRDGRENNNIDDDDSDLDDEEHEDMEHEDIMDHVDDDSEESEEGSTEMDDGSDEGEENEEDSDDMDDISETRDSSRTKSMIHRQQVRTVSISSEDF